MSHEFSSSLSEKFPEKNDPDTLVFLPLGGAGEIGMNMYLYGLGPADDRRWLMVDCGLGFAGPEAPGMELTLPDTTFIAPLRERLCGIVITHGHQDHIGALPWLWRRLRAPVYMPPFAHELLKPKLQRLAPDDAPDIRPLHEGEGLSLAPFEIEPVPVVHSIPQSFALIIRTRAGTVIHSGDWKIGSAEKTEAFSRLRAGTVRALICDSTNVLQPGRSDDEDQVADVLESLIARATGRVAVTTFASHVGRIASVFKAAHRARREVAVAGRALHQTIAAARQTGQLPAAMRFLDAPACRGRAPDKLVVLCSGSQGEPRGAMAAIAGGNHPHVALEAGDMAIFSSRTIPGNERAVHKVINGLALRGVEAITADDAGVHASGHPHRAELAALYAWLKPQAVIPMHGEPRHLRRHAAFAREQGVPETLSAVNGDIIRLVPGPVAVVGAAPSGRVYTDGETLVADGDAVIARRRKLGYAGMVVVSLALDAFDDVIPPLKLSLHGVVGQGCGGEVMTDHLTQAALEVFEALPARARREDGKVTEALTRAIRRAADRVWGKRPLCHIDLHRMHVGVHEEK